MSGRERLAWAIGRRVRCSGGCGKSWRVHDRAPTYTSSIECADCYYRRAARSGGGETAK